MIRALVRELRGWPYATLAARNRRRTKARRSGLSGELVVSLTSYPARFPTLHLTLNCLLNQTVKADRTILWIAHEDIAALPARITALDGLDIRPCDDIGPYKKLVPALEAFPDAWIATADDDVYYPPNWLESLIAISGERTITCRRANRVRFHGDRIAPYMEWERGVRGGPDILPVGAGGILYPPHSLHKNVTDRQFLNLCPTGDDLWFYWMGRRAGSSVKTTGLRRAPPTWPSSQKSNLMQVNWGGKNDEMIQALQSRWPITSSAPSASIRCNQPSERAA